MEKFIIIAGTINTGKTSTANKLISDMLDCGYSIVKYLNGNSQTTFGDIDTPNKSLDVSVVLERDGKKVVIINYGDKKDILQTIFNKINFDDYYAVVCCSRTRAARGVFDYFHDDILNKINMETTKVIPLYKDLMANHHNHQIENQNIVDTILSLLN